MPSGPLAHICFLVKDLDQAIEDWTKILEILDPAQLEERIVRYDGFEGGGDRMRWATFVNPGGAEIQLMQPDPDSPLGRRLAKHGEGVHHICFAVDSPEDALGAGCGGRHEHRRGGVDRSGRCRGSAGPGSCRTARPARWSRSRGPMSRSTGSGSPAQRPSAP